MVSWQKVCLHSNQPWSLLVCSSGLITCLLFLVFQDLAKVVLAYNQMYVRNFISTIGRRVLSSSSPSQSALQLIQELETALEEEKEKRIERRTSTSLFFNSEGIYSSRFDVRMVPEINIF